MQTLSRIIDRLTPVALRVTYGPNRSIDEHADLGAYVWGCNRCARHDGGGRRFRGDYTPTLHAARSQAKDHARSHVGMRAVYNEG